jgi:hypothetical protein
MGMILRPTDRPVKPYMLNVKSMFSLMDIRFPGSLFIDINGSDMKKINLVDWYNLGRGMGHLKLISAGDLSRDNYNLLFQAMLRLKSVCSETSPLIVPFEVCRTSAKSLFDLLLTIQNKIVFKKGWKISEDDVSEITAALTRFENVFADEIPTLATYFVSQKRIYSTRDLIEKAENVFSEGVRKKLSEQCLLDIHEAGKCIAFDLATAGGFHAVRALETVALDYVTKRHLNPNQKDLGEYIRVLRVDGADKKALDNVDQLRGLRRNPLVHPKGNLEIDEAISVFQLCTSGITELVSDMEKRGLFK